MSWELGAVSGLSHLANLKPKHLLKVGRLADEQQVEGPAPAEVGHDDCIDRHGGEELLPGGLEFLQRETNAIIDELAFARWKDVFKC